MAGSIDSEAPMAVNAATGRGHSHTGGRGGGAPVRRADGCPARAAGGQAVRGNAGFPTVRGALLLAVALLAVTVTSRPERAAAQQGPSATVVVGCPESDAPGGVAVCVDRGDGSTYAAGDPITICVTVEIAFIAIVPPPAPPTVRLTNRVDGGSPIVIFEEQLASGQRCISRRIAPPTGQETIRADLIGSDGNLLGFDTVSYRTTSAPAPSVTVDVTVDRGPGATYVVGEQIEVCATVTASGGRAYNVQLTNIVGGTVRRTIDLGAFNGRRCRTLTVTPPVGAETMRADARAATGGAVLASDAVSFLTVARPVPPPPPPPPSPVPSAPVNLRATPLDGVAIRLDWNDTSFNENGFTVFDGAGFVANVAANTTTYTVTGLAPGTFLCYYVVAFNAAGNSDSTDWACATTTPSRPLSYSTAALFLGDPRPCIPAQGSTQCSANRLALWNGDPAAWAARGVRDPNDRFLNVLLFRIEAGDPATIGAIARILGAPFLQITRLHFASSQPGQTGEFVEITNLGGGPQSLNGWSVRSETTNAVYRFASGVTLGPGQSCRVYTNLVLSDSCGPLRWNVTNAWPDTEGVAVLFYDALALPGDRTRYRADPNNQPPPPNLRGVPSIDADPVT